MAARADSKPGEKIALVVVGMHRSGTSAMARLLSIVGASLPDDLMPPAADNPSGFWESAKVADLNDEILATNDSSWDDIFAGVAPPFSEGLLAAYLSRAIDLVKSIFDDAPLIVFKDPRVSVLGEFWRLALEGAGYTPRYVIMVRDPLEVARSLAERNGFSRERSIVLWSSYMVAVEKDTRDYARTFVSYDLLLADWRPILDRIGNDLAVKLPRRTSTASVEADQFLRPTLRHYKELAESSDRSGVWPAATSLYAWFAAAALGQAPPNVSPDQYGAELASLQKVFGPVLAEYQMAFRQQLDTERQLRAAAEDLAKSNASRADQEHESYNQLSLVLETSRAQVRELEASLLAATLAQSENESLRIGLSETLDELKGLVSQVERDRDAALEAERMSQHLRQTDATAARNEQLALLEQITRAETESGGWKSDLAKTKASLEQERSDHASTRGTLLQEVSTWKAAHEQLQSALSQAQIERDKLLVEQNSLEAKFKSELAVKEAYIDDLRAQTAVQEAKATSLASELGLARSAVESQNGQIEGLESTLTYLRQTISKIQDSSDALKADVADLEVRRLAAENANSLLKADLEVSETQRLATANSNTLLKAANQELLDEIGRQISLAASERANFEIARNKLAREVNERAQTLQLIEKRHAELSARFEAISNSTSWRMTAPVRRLLGERKQLAQSLRRALKLIYWTVTLKLPERLAQRRLARQSHSQIVTLKAGATDKSPEPRRSPETTNMPAPEVHSPGIEKPRRFDHGWKIAESPNVPVGRLQPYEARIDDLIPPEAETGKQFLAQFGLLGPSPRFSEAIAYLNARHQESRRGSGQKAPRVSIVIPVYGQLAYTLNCLDSLVAHESRFEFEILIGDDRSPDQSSEYLPRVGFVRYFGHEKNLGFIRNCNAVAASARGQFVVMLNNDVRVCPSWLDKLIGSFELFPQAGLVGSKLFYPDGSLQEAGGIIWKDGSAWNYGRNDDPNLPEYSYARQVDYISGASIALPTELWESLGGFDELYAPAYCEDSDLAFRVRQAGREVWMQPLSRVIHYEGKTSGTDVGAGVKSYQVINQKKLFARWEGVLQQHRPNGVDPKFERERNLTKRVLVIDATAPTPDQDAGSVTTVKVMEVFQELGFKVTYIPLDNWLYQPAYIDPLRLRGIECIYAPYYLSLDTYLRENGHIFDVVHIFRFGVLEKALPLVQSFCPNAQIVFNNMDLHYLRLERQAEVEGSSALKAQAKETKAAELLAMSKTDIICVPSTLEKDLLDAEPGLTRPVAVMPFMIDIPTPATIPATERSDILFLGGYRHAPNVDAAVWLAKEIWPLVKAELPGARLVLAGANPDETVLALSSADIFVPGRLDDLDPLFAKARVFVAPLRYGAGVKGKIYSAFGAGVPVVSTSIGFEGMDAEDGLHGIVADDPAAITRAIVDLHKDTDLWSHIASQARQFVVERHGVPAGVQVMKAILESGHKTA